MESYFIIIIVSGIAYALAEYINAHLNEMGAMLHHGLNMFLSLQFFVV